MNELVDKVLPAYPFIQYNDDENVVAFFESYNELAQEYLTVFNTLNLSFWGSDIISGQLLDWIALGIYGAKRERIIKIDYPETKKKSQEEYEIKTEGVYNTIEYNAVAYNEFKNKVVSTAQYMSDDFFKRILLWNFFKDDGFQFSLPWLKRRIARFFRAIMGDPFNTENGYDLTYYSVTVDKGLFTIKIDQKAYTDSNGLHQDLYDFFKICIETRVINLPFQYSFVVK